MMGLPSSLLLEDSLSSYIFHAAPPSSSWQWWIEVFIVLNWFLVYPEFLCFIASIFSYLLPYIHCIKGWFYNYILTQVWSLPTFQISPSLFTAPFQRKCYGFKELTRSVHVPGFPCHHTILDVTAEATYLEKQLQILSTTIISVILSTKYV